MADEPRITDHDEILAAARADASQECARIVRLSLTELWRLIHTSPIRSAGQQDTLRTE